MCLAFIICIVKSFVCKRKKNLSTATASNLFSSTLVCRLCYMIVLLWTNNTLLQLPVLSLQAPLYISSALQYSHYYAKRAGFIFESSRNHEEQKDLRYVNGWDCRLGMAEAATSNRVELTVPLWLCLPRNFSSDTELGIRSTSPVRRSPNKERPYELLIAIPPHPTPTPSYSPAPL